jgi:hypothetical protein
VRQTLLLFALVSLVASTTSAAPSGRASIRVIDAVTGLPVGGVEVRASGAAAVTGADGVASIDLPAGRHRAALSRPGWVGASTDVRTGVTAVEVAIYRSHLADADRELADLRIRALPDDTGIESPPDLDSVVSALTYADVPDTIDVTTTDGETLTLDLEDYVKGVLPKEIGTSFPAEAMKAQAVAARTYAVYYVLTKKKPICTTTTCQVWSATHYAETDAAVDATAGVVVTYDGNLVSTNFAASCGGATANSEDVWSSALPYLRGVPCIENRQDRCEVVCTPEMPKDDLCWGVFGHRVGLCQRGAQSMGKCGSTFTEILHHYYTGVLLEPIESPDPVEPAPEPLEPVAEPVMEPAPEPIAETGEEAWGEEVAGDASVGDPTVVTAKPLTSPSCAAGGRGGGTAALAIVLAVVALGGTPRGSRGKRRCP